MGVEKVRKDDTARTFEFLFRFNRVWINTRLLLLLFIILRPGVHQGSYGHGKVMENDWSWKSHGKVMENYWSWKSHGIQ